MSSGKSRVTRWTALVLVLVFTIVSSGVLMLTPQPAEAAVTVEQAKAWGKRIAALNHGLVVKADSTVVGWGWGFEGQLDIPVGLKGVVSVVTCRYNSLALKADGTIVSWGQNKPLLEHVNNVVAIAGGLYSALALKADGTVVAWGEPWGQNVAAGLQNVVAISVGWGHFLALKADGTVVAWGDNDSGQCNVPSGLTNVIAVAGSGRHSLALKADRTVVAWGDNTKGQCNVPADLRNVVAIAGTENKSMALKSDGTVVCWGDGGDAWVEGQNDVIAICGSNVYDDILVVKSDGSLAVKPGFLSSTLKTGINLFIEEEIKVDKIAAGGNHCLALKSNGTVIAWGNNTQGECNVPAGLSNVVSIASGECHCLALKADGKVVAWGRNNYLQCSGAFNLTDVVSVAAGQMHSMALKADGTVAVWGYNKDGECDIPADLCGVIAIAAGNTHCLALKADGTVVAWGYNGNGQCNVPAGLSNVVAIDGGANYSLALKADGTVVAWGTDSFNQFAVLQGLNNVVDIATGYCHTLVLKADGKVVAMGYNGYGQCNVPYDLNNVMAIAVGPAFGHHSMALKTDGTVVVWGYNLSGQCNVPDGLNLAGSLSSLTVGGGTLSPTFTADTSNYTAKVKEGVSTVGITATLANPSHVLTINGQTQTSGITKNVYFEPGDNVIRVGVNDGLFTTRIYTITVEYEDPVEIAQQAGKRISAGYYHNAVINVDGTVSTWGYGSYKRGVPAGLNNVIAVDASMGESVFALKADGTVTAWGNNENGICDFANSLSNVAAISGGRFHALALKTDGTVAASGLNSDGECDVPTGLDKVVAVEAGYYFSVALKADGTVVAWGQNNQGQCNVPAGLSNVVAISAGSSFSLALKVDGTVVAWGNNYSGQCNVPAGLSSVVAISAGTGFSVALKADGTVVAWGDDTYGICSRIPEGLKNVIAIDAGTSHSIALKNDGTVVAWGRNWSTSLDIPAGLNLAGGLSGLNVSTGALSPVFNKGTLSYTAPANWDTTSANVTATLEYPGKQQLSINGVGHSSGTVKTVTLSNDKLVTIDVRIPEAGLARTYMVNLTPISNIKMTDFENLTATKTVIGSQVHSKLGFNLQQAVTGLNINLNIPEGFEIFAVDGLYNNSGQKLSITADKFVITDNKISINTPIAAGVYDLKFVLIVNTLSLPVSVESMENHSGGAVNPTGASMDIKIVDFPNIL